MTIQTAKINYGVVMGGNALWVAKLNYGVVVYNPLARLVVAKVSMGVVIREMPATTGRRRQLVNT